MTNFEVTHVFLHAEILSGKDVCVVDGTQRQVRFSRSGQAW
jgi:hypothetical protein